MGHSSLYSLIISAVDLMTINVETTMIDSGYYLEKEFTELIHMNP